MRVQVTGRQGATLLTLSGKLTRRQVAVLRQATFRAERERPGPCLVDLTDVVALDGFGLAALVGLVARWGSGRVVAFGVRPDLRERFAATFADQMIPLRPHLTSALEAVACQ